ncbi:MAG: hypothetical protein IPJ65_43960 [Archangiaceae bacterium]|nr:hypothetical protein [Archangiaceae bacterium]
MSLAAVVMATLAAAPAALDEARAAYEALDFDRCVAALAPLMAEPPSDSAERAQTHVWMGLCEHQRRHVATAERHFDEALSLDPALELPPHTSPKVVALFESVRALHAPAAPAKAPPEPALAAEARPAERAPPLPAAAPPTLSSRPAARSQLWPRLALGFSALTASTGLVLGLLANQAETESFAQHFQSESLAAAARSRGLAVGANVAYGVAAASLAAAALLYFFGPVSD